MTTFTARARAVRAISSVRVITFWERFIGGAGLTLTLAGLVLLSVVMTLQEGNWVPGMPAPLLIAALGGAAGWAMHRRGWTTRRAVLTSWGAGLLFAAYAGTSTAEGFAITARAVHAIEDIARWAAAIPTEETQPGAIEFAMFLTLAVWLLSVSGIWLALRSAHGWTTVVFGGVVLAFALSNLPEGLEWRLGIFMATSVMLLIHLSTGAADRRVERDAGRCSTHARCSRSPASCWRSGCWSPQP